MDNTADQPDTRITTQSGPEAPHTEAHHGSTPAAWTAVTIILIAFTLGAIAIVLGPNWVLFWVSVALAVVGCIAGKVLQLLGFGVQRAGQNR
jgi:hypothetical protein